MSGSIDAPFRIAMREEGTMWNFYLAPVGSMVGARVIGSIALALVRADEPLKNATLALMQAACVVMVREVMGMDCTTTVEIGPERERGGHG